MPQFTQTALLILGMMILSMPLRADEVTIAKEQLTRQESLIATIAYTTERHDRARLMILRDASRRVLTMIDSVGLGHMQTLREYQVQIVTYRFSQEFLRSITTGASAPAIEELQTIQQRIIEDRGMDDTPYTRITYSIFSQMREQLLLLQEQRISQELSERITALNPQFGNVLALAQDGDRPRTFEAAKVLYFEIQSLYPALDAISGSSPAYDLSLTIRGLNEFYAEFGQIH